MMKAKMKYRYVNTTYQTKSNSEFETKILLQIGELLLNKGLITNSEYREYQKIIQSNV